MFRAKYGYLLEDEDVRRWFDNLAAKSLLTATVYLRNLGLYCKLNGTDPKGILRDAGSKAFKDRFADFVRRLEREGKAGSYIARFKKVLNSWLAFNGINVKLKVNVKGESDAPTIANERVPNREELDRILSQVRKRCAIASYFLKYWGILGDADIAILYAIAMGVDALVAFPIGYLYDTIKFKSLYVAPITMLMITLLFTAKITVLAYMMAVLWGVTMGVSETIMRASIADIVGRDVLGSSLRHIRNALRGLMERRRLHNNLPTRVISANSNRLHEPNASIITSNASSVK
ncbi:MAG: hypothetical protein QXM67_00715 [Candidatus Methanomethylicia archaeon]